MYFPAGLSDDVRNDENLDDIKPIAAFMSEARGVKHSLACAGIARVRAKKLREANDLRAHTFEQHAGRHTFRAAVLKRKSTRESEAA